MKPTFLHRERPLLTCMAQSENPTDAICHFREAMLDGADAIGFQIDQFSKEYRTDETYKSIFYFADDKPIYVTNYRGAKNEGTPDEELSEGLFQAVRCGATLVDLMGDYFDRSKDEITHDPAAIDKQKKLIDSFHEAGAEVLMSSHTFRFMNHDEVLAQTYEMEKRGADIAKIVTASNTEEEMMENLKTTQLLKKELHIPYLFLSCGPWCKMHRTVGPMLGCCMWLTVQTYDKLATKDQPLLRATREVVNNFDWKPHRS